MKDCEDCINAKKIKDKQYCTIREYYVSIQAYHCDYYKLPLIKRITQWLKIKIHL